MPTSIAICGVSGFIGRTFSKLLLHNGYNVRVISCDDLFIPPTQLGELISGCEAVFNLSGASIFARWNDANMHDIYCSRLDVTHRFVNAFKYAEKKPKLYFAASFAAQYDMYEVHDEFSSAYDNGFLAEVSRVMEREALQVCRVSEETRLVIGRLGYVFGKNGGVFSFLKHLSENGFGGSIGSGYQCIPIVHIDDVVNSLWFFLENEKCSGVYNIVTPKIFSLSEICSALSNSLSMQHQIALPEPLLKLFLGDVASHFLVNRKVLPTRLLSHGFMFTFPNVNSIIKDLCETK